MIVAELFLGLSLKHVYVSNSPYISSHDETCLQKVEHCSIVYLGKKVPACTTLAELELLRANILSLLVKMDIHPSDNQQVVLELFTYTESLP